MNESLTLAQHEDEHAFWAGGEYELNMSFGMLRDRQWQRVMEHIWSHPALDGPFHDRYVPGATVTPTVLRVPAPTDAQTQNGILTVQDLEVGCRVLATRSLFECVTIQVPLGMFATVSTAGQSPPVIPPLDALFVDIALDVFEVALFDVASLGVSRECYLISEILVDGERKADLLHSGNLLVRDHILAQLGADPNDYEALEPGLRWVPPPADA